ncbi:ABC transporter ATP-binding protein [Pigmentiphaga sp. YJ18]|uniref:ABC transporter ATP-binding protein n=1 Tax=Pigmentiphaga sp. YJ18 TaxID=3134907 RepID=UPI00310E4D24
MPPAERAAPNLLARDIHGFYGDSHILHGVDLIVGRGESVGLLGRNGMGKSTLIKSCLGLQAKMSGEIKVGGTRVDGWRPERIARLGVAYVPEGRGIFSSLSVLENLKVAARRGPDGRQDWSLDRVLDLFTRLVERLGNGGAQLSGGEQQMLSIGRALMTNPDLLVIDEVTEGLAPLVMREIWATVDRVKEAGMACLLVDRNYRSVLESTDRCYFMEKGRVVWEGASPEALADRDMLARYLGV